jgi:hypothetical protein
MTALAAAATIALTSPANAAVTLTTTNGTPLQAAIHASQTDSTNDALNVFGSIAQGGQSADVLFTGDTDLHITGGAGFASITDSAADGTLNLFNVIINPDADFTDIKFSIQLAQAGDIAIFYMLTGGGGWVAASPVISQDDKQNNNYLLSGGTFDAIKISSTGALFEVKQNSINLAPNSVPEPATWGMMLLGFAGMGMAIRRSRRRNGALMQIA